MNLKPYLQLDLTKPTAAKHAKMALRLLQPWEGHAQDPMNLTDEVAIGQLEEFARGPNAPRWFRQRFEHHNREKRGGSTSKSGGGSVPPPPAQPKEETERRAFDACVAPDAKVAAVRAHGLLWDKDPTRPDWSVREALQHSRSRPHQTCLREMLQKMNAVDGQLPRSRAALTELVVLHILYVDLEDYVRNRRGVVNKKCLPKYALDNAAQAWRDYHPSAANEQARKALAP